MRISDQEYRRLVDARFQRPTALRQALADRPRRRHSFDQPLLIVAADHPARGALAVGDDPTAMADRAELLGRLQRVLAHPRVDGVLGSADILEELAYLGALDGRLAVGTMNRGGLAGSVWELDDPVTAYRAADVVAAGLDAGKLLLRIDDEDPGTRRTLEACAQAVTDLAAAGVVAMVEPLPFTRDGQGRPTLRRDAAALARAVAVASGIGASSAATWLKVPATIDPEFVLASAALPTLLLGGDPGPDPAGTYEGWRRALAQPAARGLVVGRALLYPSDGDLDAAVGVAAELVNEVTVRGTGSPPTRTDGPTRSSPVQASKRDIPPAS